MTFVNSKFITLENGGAQRQQSGFSLVEMMVGVLIGLIGVLVIMQAFQTNEAVKRSTTGTGEAQTNGAVALFGIERETKMAGYGITNSNTLKCQAIQWFYGSQYSAPPAASSTLPVLTVAPALITNGGTTGSDSLTIMYSSSGDRVSSTTANRGSTTPLATADRVTKIGVDQSWGFRQNDLVLMVPLSTAPTVSCGMSAITAQPAPGGVILQRAGGPFNPAATTLLDYNQPDEVYSLGQLTVTRFQINNGKLELLPLLLAPSPGQLPVPNNPAIVLSDDIVDMKVWYGKDNVPAWPQPVPPAACASCGVVDVWDKVAPTTPTEVMQIIAVRVALLARSGNYERPAVPGGACAATLATGPTSTNIKYRDPSLAPNGGPDSNGTRAFNNIPGGLPSCYKYRVFETVIPLRNVLWRQS